MSIEWIWWIAAAVLIGAELLTVSFYLLAVGLAFVLGGSPRGWGPVCSCSSRWRASLASD